MVGWLYCILFTAWLFVEYITVITEDKYRLFVDREYRGYENPVEFAYT